MRSVTRDLPISMTTVWTETALRFVRKELEDRQLIAPWGFVELPFSFMALPAAGRTPPEDMSAFIDWIRARLKADSA
jgi:LysR family transcriptional regulator, glycine cleavage system transcriptional activator